MANKKHCSVQRLILDIRHGKQGSAIEKQNKISILYHKTVAPLLEKACRELCPDDRLLKIDTLIIEVPTIAENQLESSWAREVEKAFRKSLLQVTKQNTGPENKNVSYISQADADLELLTSFLYTGMLPWSYSENRDRSPEIIFKELITNKPTVVHHWLAEGLKHSSFTKRLCHQFPELLLTELPALLHPNYAENFLNAHKILQSSFENITYLNRKPNLIFLLNYHSIQQFAKQSTWNEKYFVAEVLEQLSQEWTIPYGELLKILLQNVKLVTAIRQSNYSNLLKALYKDSVTGSEKEKVLLYENPENLKEYREKTEQERVTDETFKEIAREFLKKYLEKWTLLDSKEKTVIISFQQELQQLLQEADRIVNTVETEKTLLQKKLQERMNEFIREINNRSSEIVKLSTDLEKDIIQLSEKTGSGNEACKIFEKAVEGFIEKQRELLNSKKPTTGISFEQGLKQLFKETERIMNTVEAERTSLQKKFRKRISKFIQEIKSQPSEIAKLSADLEKDIAQLLGNPEPINSTYNTFKKDSQTLLENISQQPSNKEDSLKLDQYILNTDVIYLQNAGMVIVWSFFTQLFETLKFTEKKQFISEDKQYRAVYLLQYLVNGTEDCKEFQLPLNKLLCGLKISEPIPKQVLLTKEEKESAEDLIRAAMGYWPVMKNTSVEGFREIFLKREGKLSRSNNGQLLKVAQKSYDIIMSKLPWGVGPVKLPWMPEVLFVEW